MSVRVSGSKTAYVTKNVTSAQTAIVAIGTLKSSVPTISGTARSGYTLTAKAGTWTTGTTLKYQWYRSGVAITGATGMSYKLVTADRYDTIKVRVVGSKAGYTTATTYSASTVKVP
jgi:serine protease